MNKGLVIFLMAISVMVCSKRDSEESHIYSTWQNLEIDKCASAWLIKRFIDKEAVFKFYQVGELIPIGVPFDTPDAEFRRYHNLSTFESIMKKYKIEDCRIQKIGAIIHKLEVVSWEERRAEKDELTIELENSVRKIIESSKTPLECFEKSYVIFDSLYTNLNRTGANRNDSE